MDIKKPSRLGRAGRTKTTHGVNGTSSIPLSNGTLYANESHCTLSIDLGEETSSSLAALSSDLKSFVILAAWSIVLSKYTGDDKVSFDLLNSFNQTCSSLQEVSLGDLPHIQDIVKHLQKVGQAFTSESEYQQGLEPSLGCDSAVHIHGSTSNDIEYVEAIFPKCSFILDVVFAKNAVCLSLWCDDHEVSDGFAPSIAQTFSKALESVIASDPDTDWQMIEILSKRDFDKINQWNQGSLSTAESCIHDLFQHQAERNPSSQAVFAWDGCLTYYELDILSGNLASHLKNLGIQRGSLVPICLEKSLWVTVSILAILKAGGAVIPLDPYHPAKRLLEIVEDTRPIVVVCDLQNSDVFTGAVQTVIADVRVASQKKIQAKAEASMHVHHSDPAIVLFTSGSTGKPKGLIHTHMRGEAVTQDSVEEWASPSRQLLNGTDGSLVYLGRKDTQVKIRGQRLELGDIERHLRLELPQNAVAVDTSKSPDGVSTLIAFVAFESTPTNFSNLANKVQFNLQKSLPSYMIPALFIPIKTLPMNESNKLDRRMLRHFAHHYIQNRQESSSSLEQLSSSLTAIEQRLADLWIQVLKIGVALKATDNFFVLGANSLTAIALVSRAREAGLRISVADIMLEPSLSGMAHMLTPIKSLSRAPVPYELIRSEEKDRILDETTAQSKMPRSDVEDIYPCTPTQEGLFALSLASPGTYVALFKYEIPTNISLPRFQNAWAEVIRRSPILRTRIVQFAGQHYQVIDQSAHHPEISHINLEQYLTSDKHQNFHYGQPLLHSAIFISDASTNFVLTMHHSIFDAWSLNLVWKEVEAVYMNEPAPSRPPFCSFVHYIQQNTPISESSKSYWQKHFQGSSPALFPPLPSASYRPKADVQSSTYFQALQTRAKVTLAITIRAAWALLIGQYSGSKDLTFGMTQSGRFAEFDDIDKLIGPTLTTLPVRVRIDPSASVHEFLQGVRRRAADMVPYEHIGLQTLAQLSPEAQEACNFPSILVVHPEDDDTGPFGAKARMTHFVLPHALVVECHLKTSGIILEASYDSQVIQTANVQRLMAQFAHVVQQSCKADGDAHVDTIQLTSPADLQDIQEWNANLSAAENDCIHSAIELQVAKNPTTQAICGWDGSLAYKELDVLASRLASHISAGGVGPEVIVPLCFDKSKYAIISLLAVLKAGGACLFLEPTWPVSRIDFILQAVNSPVVIADSIHADKFVQKASKVVTVSESLFNQPELAHPISGYRQAQPSNASFVFFTSGSTGTPKGIVQSHSALLTSSRNHASTCRINEESRTLQFSAFTFDVYEIEIVTTLTHGGCVCIPSEHDRMNNLSGAMEEMQANWAFFTPTFCRSMDPSQMPHLKTLLVGGEAVDKATVDKWVDHVTLLNCYGPAECGPTVMCELTPSHRPESIGMPLCCRSWIVDPDDHNKLAPVGSVGELLLEGYTMARGYLNEPEKTAASFIPAPKWLEEMAASHGSKLYKTGDLVKYAEDGSIDFIGRKDTQVKIRGQRMELGEIEHHLRQCLPATIDAAAEVVQLDDGKERKSLVAFICARSAESRSDPTSLSDDTFQYHELVKAAQDLKPRMEQLVPTSMVPSAVLLTTAMPVNASGKLDRKVLQRLALQTPLQSSNWLHSGSTVKTKIETVMERTLQQLWKTCLKVDSIMSREDDFFRLGGDSISAMSLVASVRMQGYSLSVGQIFKNPTLEQMANAMSLARSEDKNHRIEKFALLPQPNYEIPTITREIAGICHVNERSIEDIYPCTTLQEGMLAQSLTRPGSYLMQNVYSLPSHIDLDRFRAAWDMIIQQEPIFRTRILQTSVGTLQAVMFNVVKWEEAEKFESYVARDKSSLIEHGQSMTRLALFHDDFSNTARFVLTIHHCLYDGWMLELAWKAVTAAYAGSCLPTSAPFNRFIQYLSSIDRNAQKKFWQTQLADANKASFPEIPTGHLPSASSIVAHSAMCTILNGQYKLAATTPAIIRAAWSLLISRYSMTEDVTFGAVSIGRTAPVADIERIAAPLIATVPVRVQIDRRQRISSYLEQIQEQATEMIPYEHTGLQNIKSYLDSETQHVCDLQTLLVIQPANTTEETIPGVECISEGVDFKVPHALAVICSLIPDGIELQASFDPVVLESETVRRMLGHLANLINHIYHSNRQTTLGELELIDEAETKEILIRNRKEPPITNRCIHDVIQQITDHDPQGTAVVAWDGQFTYQQLNDQSARIARDLGGRGVRPDEIVPLLSEKSKWVVASIIGIMKAGAAFVLIDTATPDDRLRSILNITNARVALTSSECAGKFPPGTLSEIVVFTETDTGYSQTKTHPDKDPTSIAYVNFTSGTTSQTPKAAVVEHKAFTTAALEHGIALEITSHSRILQFASYNFDSAIWEMLVPLMHGGCVCIPSEMQRLDDLTGFMQQTHVDLAVLTPTVARASLRTEELGLLKTLLLVGEPMSRDDLSRYNRDKVRLLNGYGLAECCVCSSILEPEEGNLGAIGKPIASNFWITDPEDHDRLAPLGAIGELLIEGSVLAREYLGDEARTKASFVKNPAWSRSLRPMRLYKTGDLVKMRPDGNLTLLGRKDMQVKLRGQRIDLTEVERVIKKHVLDGTAEVACDALLHAGRKTLAAFVCSEIRIDSRDNDLLASSPAFRKRLDATILGSKYDIMGDLPQHMIPSLYIPVTQIPLLPSGKVNRRKLASVTQSMSAEELAQFSAKKREDVSAPMSQAESALAKEWSSIFEIPPEIIRVTDDFFTWGDSIGAIKLTALLRKQGMLISAVDIMRHPVLADMATKVTEAQVVSSGQLEPFALIDSSLDDVFQELHDVHAIRKNEVEDVYPCTPLQEGLMALSVKQRDSFVARNIHHLPSSVYVDRFYQAWRHAIEVNAILRTTIVQTRKSGLLQVVLKEQRSWVRPKDLAEYLAQDKRLSLGFGKDLNRFALVEDFKGWYFVWTSHHATYDGWSVNLIFQQVDQHYRRLSVENTLPFNIYIQHITSIDTDATKAFWLAQSTTSNSVVFPMLPEKAYTSKADRSLTHVQTLVPGSRLSSATIHAAWALLASKYVNSQDMTFGIVMNGRTDSISGIDRVVGPTIATVPLSMSINPNMTFRALVESVEQKSLNMIPFAHYGLQNIRKLSPEAERLCNFQTILIVQPDTQVDLPCGAKHAEEESHELSSFNNYGLMLEVQLGAKSLTVTANFDSKLIDTTLMEGMLSQLGYILEQTQVSARMGLKDVEFSSPRETEDQIRFQGSRLGSKQVTVQGLISAQAGTQGDKHAIEGWDGKLAYLELEKLSTNLAAYLVSHAGSQQKSIVSIYFARSTWTTIAMIAVLKAGGAVILLDPTYPVARLSDIVADSGSQLLLCDPEHSDVLEMKTVVEITPGFLRGLPTQENPSISVDPDELAFAISTSGSTGKPKIMTHSHAAICTAITGYGESLNLSAESRVLQFSAYAFDMSINETLAALFHGGTLCVPSDHDRLNNLAGFIQDSGVNWMFAMPSLMRRARITPKDIPTVKTMVFGAEKTYQDDIDCWKDKVTLRSAYGPAECQVCTAGPLEVPGEIGVANSCACWIVDPENVDRLLPSGMIGELLVQGHIVSRGYLNAPETSFSVSPNWLQSDLAAKGRMFLTGDLVRIDARGRMIYEGRKEATQVKLRGQRLELGEVEYSLRSLLPVGVDVAASIVNQSDQATLVAFLSSAQSLSEKVIAQELQSLQTRLQDALPSFMVPSGYVILDALPLTSSGKIDRKKLQVMKVSEDQMIVVGSTSTDESIQLSDTGKLLQRAWINVLQLPEGRSNARSNFFRLGGDSISAMRLVSRVRDDHMQLTVADVFKYPILEEMADHACVLVDDRNYEPFSMLGERASVISEEVAQQCNVTVDQIEDVYPCTPLQEGLFALSQKNGSYVARSVFKLPSNVDTEAFKAAWDKVVSFHTILRTSISQTSNDGLLQVVRRAPPTWDIAADLDNYMARQVTMGLGEALTKCAIVDSRYFILSQHHAAYDGYSLPQVFQQVEDIYKGARTNVFPTSFGRFIRQTLESQSKASQEYWTSELRGAAASAFPYVPSGYEPVPSSYIKQEFSLDRGNIDATTPTLLRAAWALVLASYTGTQDVTFGATLSGRQAAVQQIERIVGPTITTVPIRVMIDLELQIGQYLQSIQNSAAKMIPYEQTGLQNIRDLLDDDARSACDFQNLMIVNPQTAFSYLQSDLFVPSNYNNKDAATFRTYAFNLEFTILDKNTVAAEVFFDSKLLNNDRVTRMLDQIEHVLKILTSSPSLQLKDVDLISPQDLAQIKLWNAKAKTSPSPTCVHTDIESQSKSSSEENAVSAWDGVLTYTKMQELSTHLSLHLTSLGIGPEVNVALCFEKSLWMVVAVLAVMKSGGCFVPLDPSHPKSRLNYIVDEVRAPVVLTSVLHKDLFDTSIEVSEAGLDNMSIELENVYPKQQLKPSNSLYILYTSGSTGKPKGVVIEHQAFASASKSRRTVLGLDQHSKILQFGAYSFDTSVEDMLSTLMAGGCICIPSEEERRDSLAQAIAKYHVNYADLTPSVANLLNPQDVPGLKTLVLAGEAVPEVSVRIWQGRVRLINAYGPTESSVLTHIQPNLTLDMESKNIGTGVGCKTWLVDEKDHNKLVPIGAPGELLIEGPGLARGYLNDDAKTRAGFIENPSWAEKPMRAYKTGDLVRYDSDGSVVYLRRINETQVKIRGQRVELGEIESQLRIALKEARDIAVDTVQQESKAPVLTAFVALPSVDRQATKAEIASKANSELQEALPVHMLPTVYVFVGTIPLASSAKIDRRRLQQIAIASLLDGSAILPDSSNSSAEKPTSDLELRMQAIWSEVLNIPQSQISTSTPFFNLGGDSISAIQVVARSRRQQLVVTSFDILKHKTIAKICKAVEERLVEEIPVEIEDVETEAPFELSPIQRQFFQTMPEGNNLFQQSFLLEVQEDVSPEMVKLAVDRIVAAHPMLKARFEKRDGEWRSYVSSGNANGYPFQTELGEEIEVVRQRIDQSINVENGPVFAAAFLPAQAKSVVYLTAHHLVIDLVSWRIILADLEELFRSPNPLIANEPLSFRTWCRLQRDYIKNPLNSTDLLLLDKTKSSDLGAYWGAEAAHTYEETTSDHFSLDRESSTSLIGGSNGPLKTEPVEIFLAALAHSFHTIFTDREPPSIFNESHGREPWFDSLDLSRTVGWFTTMYPLNVNPNDDMIETVIQTKDARRSMRSSGWQFFTSHHLNSHNNVPLNPEIIFNYQGHYQQFEREDAMFKLLPIAEPAFSRPGANVIRQSPIEISAIVQDKQIRFDFVWNRHMAHQAKIQRWIQQYQQTLHDAAHLLPVTEPRWTLSDFPLLPPSFKAFSTLSQDIIPHLPSPIADIYPCSPLQRKMLTSQLATRTCYQTITTFLALPTHPSQEISIERLQRAWQKLVDTHPLLRTCLLQIDDHAVQIEGQGRVCSPAHRPISGRCTGSPFPQPALR
ncbi:NRPS [Bacidia gigantensis]|uniref:NRPS n=1 Tax=Bacidia gigantensis TaxID=2732470 RepID=UPI001D03C2B6|nr:NRPS [Bacidia gigantensis]KAG8525214.1 NRPS [Bacidia gigantensis]